MSSNLAAIGYLVAAVCFIMALRGLSSPETARKGNFYGIAGMAIAILATMFGPQVHNWWWILGGIIIGGGIGFVVAQRIQMTALPQLVAAFHSLVGLAAVMVAAAAPYAPESFGIGTASDIHGQALIEMSIGVATGSHSWASLKANCAPAQ